MEVDQDTHLLDLPNEILEKIVEYLPFVAARKRLRLTCKRLHSLCNLERFCQDEAIVWPRKVERQSRLIAAFSNSTRGCYNLKFKSVPLDSHEVPVFFQQHGAKVRSLLFECCGSLAGVLESIITSCEGLVSLIIDPHCHSYDLSFESNSVIRPSVTSLTLRLDYFTWQKTPNIIYRFLSTFPCIKHLNITTCDFDGGYMTTTDLPVVSSFMSNLSHLQSLRMSILVKEFLTKEPKFPKFKELHLHLNFDLRYALHPQNTWPIFISRLKGAGISSIYLASYTDIHLTDIIPLLHETGFESIVTKLTKTIHLTLEDFQVLVSSHLKTIRFDTDIITAPWADTTYNFPGEANKTVTNMIIEHSRGHAPMDNFSFMVIFPTHFQGLTHLDITPLDDVILQSIFKYQKNLRSLSLSDCARCSLAGFFGAGDVQFANSVTNLLELEHLKIIRVEDEVFQSKLFQSAFSFPRLKYLSIRTMLGYKYMKPTLEIPVDMLKSCVNLEAVELDGFIPPARAIFSSLFQSLKCLNFLLLVRTQQSKWFTYVNLKHFYWFDSERLLSDCSPREVHYDQNLDRTVFSCDNGLCAVPIHSPKFGSYTVEWIRIHVSVQELYYPGLYFLKYTDD